MKEISIKPDAPQKHGADSAVSRFIRERWIDTLRFCPQDKGTNLALPVPYTVPCAKDGFQHLHYWDIYFACRGLEVQGLPQLVKWNCDALIHLLNRFGFVPNASCNYLIVGRRHPNLNR